MITKHETKEAIPCGHAVVTQYIDDEQLDNGATPPGMIRQDVEIQVDETTFALLRQAAGVVK